MKRILHLIWLAFSKFTIGAYTVGMSQTVCQQALKQNRRLLVGRCASIAIYGIAFLLFGCVQSIVGADINKTQQTTVGVDSRDDASPWGMGCGSGGGSFYKQFNPMLRDAGVRWLRMFPEWQNIQPRKGEWNWTGADAIVASARAHNIHILGIWLYFASWTSANGDTRTGPVKDMQYWRDYVTATASRYKNDIKYWEVWNEPNDAGFYRLSPGRKLQDKINDYARLTVEAYDAIKKVDPTMKIGMSVASSDIPFLDQAIKAGAADHFDFLCIHPYGNMDAMVSGDDANMLGLADSLNRMLAANKQRKDIQLWITESGLESTAKPDAAADDKQAEALVKLYIVTVAQGFNRIFWFEAYDNGRDAGKGREFGVIRSDWTVRPSYVALKTMTGLLGAEPKYLGWLNLDNGGYGFVFSGANETGVLAAWTPTDKDRSVTFASNVRITDLSGKSSELAAGKALALKRMPVFVSNLPASLIKQAQGNRNKPFPWGADYATAKEISCRLSTFNVDSGLKQIHQDTTVVDNGAEWTCRRTDFSRKDYEGHYVYFSADPRFAPYGTKNLEFTVVAKRVAPDKVAFMDLMYESITGYRETHNVWTIPADDQWHEHTWKVNDASFVGQWGFNFRISAVGSPNEFLIKEVRVSKPEQSGK